jgi:phage protein U
MATQAQLLLGLLRDDIQGAAEVSNTSIYFYTPRPGIASPGYNSLQRDANFTWLSQGRLSRDPAMQFTGAGEETVTIEGRLYPQYFGGFATMNKLRAAGQGGHRFMLTRYYTLADLDANGNESTTSFKYATETIGRYGVRRVREGQTRIGSHGLPDILEFTIELVKLGEDAGDGTTGEFLFASRETKTPPNKEIV